MKTVVAPMHLTVLICALILTTCHSVEIPSFLKKCDRKNDKFDKCLAAAIEDALARSTNPVKEIALARLEPLEIPLLVFEKGSGAVAFEQNYQNLKVSGFSRANCSKAEMNFDTNTLTIDCGADLARLDYNYEVNGKLLLLPIVGKGPGFIEMHNLSLHLTFSLEEYEKNGKTHYKVVDNKLILMPQLMKFRMDNLFDGDKILGDNINQVLNDNWSEVFAEVKPNYEEAFGKIFTAIFENVLKKVSKTELFGNP
ncbi:protein takeout-like [Zophobas morio]|uniref:protein takeout-like n=1 Tax=Zophobas morio TaxID=2755281 RepID=UPI003083817D